MHVVTIPFDYEKLSPAEQAGIIPICIKATDDKGNPIAWGWFEAVERVQDNLRLLAKSCLNDVWRVSEITEAAVHRLWNLHGNNLGRHPSRRVYAAAKWEAQDRKAGCWQRRRKTLLALDELEYIVHRRVLVDPVNYGRVYEEELFFKELSERLEGEGLDEVSHILKLLRDGRTWDEIGSRVGKQPAAARMRFRRWIKRLFSDLVGPVKPM
jgi:hypothetical protein